MATTGALVFAGNNRLRYLVTNTDNAAGVIVTNTGGATPDLLTDSAGKNGPIRKMALQFTTGYGKLPAGALTQAQARAIYDSNDPSNVVGTNILRAMVAVTPRSGSNNYQADVNVDGAGKMTISVTPGVNSAGTCYLDIFVPGAIGA